MLKSFVLCAAVALAGETRLWRQSEYSEFEKGVMEKLSLRSDGAISPAPRFHELYDASAGYLWALAQDSKGNLYAGGGPGARIHRLSPKGDNKVVAELEGLEIHALAVDRQDRLYAATSPDGKVFRLGGGGKAEVFYDPKTKYIWALAFNSRGELLVATGDGGEVHRVTADGKGGVFFRTDETHARSLAIDAQDHVIVGTDPSGLVLRVSPRGEGFVLYQMGKKEVSAVAAARDGSVWAAGVGTKQPYTLPPPGPVAPSPAPAPTTGAATGGAAAAQARPAAPPPTTLGPAAPSISGGSEVWRIDPSGHPRRVWTHAQDIVYALAFDPQGRALAGTGNRGYIYRLESESQYTALLNAAPTQITGLLPASDGRLYVASANVGKVYEMGPGLEREGFIESDVFDARIFSTWGRVSFQGEANGGQIALATRSGNLDQPHKNWSPWSAAVTNAKGARADSPPARFIQWRATLTSAGGQPPSLHAVEVAYLPRNVEPRVEIVEITPPNYRFPAPSAGLTATPSLTLPPLGRRRPQTPALALEAGTTTPAMQYAKGSLSARWAASDENGDELVYTVQIRGAGETEWKPLKDKVKEKYLTWDSTAFPDGTYRLRVIASDQPANPPSEALTGAGESVAFQIDNTPPRISGLAATRSGATLTVRWKAADALNHIQQAEYSLDGGEWTVITPVGKLSDSPELEYMLMLENLPPGEHTVAVRAEDACDNQATEKTVVR